MFVVTKYLLLTDKHACKKNELKYLDHIPRGTYLVSGDPELKVTSVRILHFSS